MREKRQTFSQRCDKCRALVIFDVGTMDKYTVTEYDPLKISFYCPSCIEKYGIVTDANRPIENPFIDEVSP